MRGEVEGKLDDVDTRHNDPRHFNSHPDLVLWK
jgi:hypothetical protein